MSFNDREKGIEKRFSMDQEAMFKIEARASKLIGLWAAEKFGLSGADAEKYAKEVIAANLDEPGYDDIRRKLKADFKTRQIVVEYDEMESILEKSIAEATKQVEQERNQE